MKVFAGLIIAASATQDRIGQQTSWPANDDAPHCGCQKVLDANNLPGGSYINATCTIQFPYADEIHYGRTQNRDPHFVSVASAYMLGRNRDPENIDGFKFTGFDQVSNPDALDVLVFYEKEDCYGENGTHTLTQEQLDMMCVFELECVDNGSAIEGVHLGNFNYDIARSVQTYTVPIYGLGQGQQEIFQITDYYNEESNCANALAHEGHGFASGCSSNSTGNTGCSNYVTFLQNENHNGLLEYFQFEPVSPVSSPVCFNQPEHHDDDYQWLTPSPWDTQENFVNPDCAFQGTQGLTNNCITPPGQLPQV